MQMSGFSTEDDLKVRSTRVRLGAISGMYQKCDCVSIQFAGIVSPPV